MDDFLTALAHDMAGDYERAVEAYERAVLQPQIPVDAFINLSFIYWESVTQQSLTFTNGTAIPATLYDKPWETCFRVLEAGLQCYPKDLELNFWERYYRYRGIFDDFSAADCQQLLVDCVDHNQTLLPYFFLSLFDRELYSAEVTQILLTSQQCPTAKNRWVTSIIEPRPYER